MRAEPPPAGLALAGRQLTPQEPHPCRIDTQWWHGLPEEQRAGFFEAVAAASPVRRVGTPADVAAAIVYLAGAGFVTGTVLE